MGKVDDHILKRDLKVILYAILFGFLSFLFVDKVRF